MAATSQPSTVNPFQRPLVALRALRHFHRDALPPLRAPLPVSATSGGPKGIETLPGAASQAQWIHWGFSDLWWP